MKPGKWYLQNKKEIAQKNLTRAQLRELTAKKQSYESPSKKNAVR